MANIKHKPVKFSAEEMAYDLPPEIDFSELKRIRAQPKSAGKQLHGDALSHWIRTWQRSLHDPKTINDALRSLIELARTSTKKTRKSA